VNKHNIHAAQNNASRCKAIVTSMQVRYFFTEILETFHKNKGLKQDFFLLCISHFLHPLVIVHFTDIPTTMIMK